MTIFWWLYFGSLFVLAVLLLVATTASVVSAYRHFPRGDK